LIKDLDKCLICGVPKKEFSKLELNFIEHISKDHNIWNYLSFIYYLSSTKENALFSQEIQILEKIKRNDSSWIPIERSLSLGILMELCDFMGF